MQPLSAPQGAAAPIMPAAVLQGRRPNDGSRTLSARPTPTQAFERDNEIFCEGDPAETFYEVVSGAVRTYKLLGDGRRQIDAFHLPGDIFGIEAGAGHRFSAEAIGAVTLRSFRRRSLETLAAGDPALACRLVEGMAQSLERAQDHMLLLGRKCAREKIASFLLGLSNRVPDGRLIDLPMSRIDIADHLGLTIETVSRSLTQLQREKIIEFPEGRRLVVLRDPAALRRLDAGDQARPTTRSH